MRILPLLPHSISEVKKKERFLLDWVSTFGFSPNKIELDRAFLQEKFQSSLGSKVEITNVTKQELLEKIHSLLQKPFSKEKSLIIRQIS